MVLVPTIFLMISGVSLSVMVVIHSVVVTLPFFLSIKPAHLVCMFHHFDSSLGAFALWNWFGVENLMGESSFFHFCNSREESELTDCDVGLDAF